MCNFTITLALCFVQLSAEQENSHELKDNEQDRLFMELSKI